MRVDRYKKLVRSDVNAVGLANHQVITITTPAAIRIARPMWAGRLLLRVINTNASGHRRYHCSSTAKLHRWRSGEKLPKYWAPPKIWPQLAK